MREFFLRLWIAVAGFFTYWYLKLHVYKAWSYTYRWLFERKYKDVQIPAYASLQEIAAKLDAQKWRADGALQLWDTISTPERAFMVLSGQETTKVAFDCDEFMIFAVATIRMSLMNSEAFVKNEKKLVDAFCLTVTWVELQSGKATGHNVALLVSSGEEKGSSRYSYMDYGMPTINPKETIEEVVEAVRTRYSDGPFAGLAFAVSELDLTPTKVVRG